MGVKKTENFVDIITGNSLREEREEEESAFSPLVERKGSSSSPSDLTTAECDRGQSI